jgi:hypothetical protein
MKINTACFLFLTVLSPLNFLPLQAQSAPAIKVIEEDYCFDTIAKTLWELPPNKFLVINIKFQIQVLKEQAKLQGVCLSENMIGAYRRIMQVSRALIYHCDKRLSSAGYSLLEFMKSTITDNPNNIKEALNKVFCQIEKEAPLFFSGGDFCLNAAIFNCGQIGTSSIVVNVDRLSVTVRGGFGTLYQEKNGLK